MSLITIPNVFSAGAVIIASQHNSNFSVISSDYNGNIDNNNIAPAAAISYSKLSMTNSIVNADINSSASIATSKINFGTANQGDLFVDKGSGIVRLTPGTSGQYLKTQGAGANPVWADLVSGKQIFTSNGTFTAPTGVTTVFLTLCGGGGGAGGTQGTSNHKSGSGASGACVINYPYTVVPGNNYSVTIGGGGNGGSAGNNPGTQGSSSVFDTLTVLGGNPGTGGSSTTDGTGGTSLLNSAGISNAGSSGGYGGSSPIGIGGTAVSNGTGGNAADNSGGGGGATVPGDAVARAGGNGGSGICIVMY